MLKDFRFGLGISVLSSWPFNTSKQGRVDTNRTSTRRWSYMKNAQIPFWVSYAPVKQNHEVTKSKEIRAAAVFKGCVENHGPVERQSFFFWFPVFRPRPRSMFRTPGPAVVFMKRYRSKKNALHTTELRPYQVTLEKASLKLGKDWQKKTVMSSWLLNMASSCFFSEKTRPFHKRIFAGFFLFVICQTCFYLPEKVFSQIPTANAPEKLPKPNRRLVFQPSFLRGELLNFGVYIQIISCASVPTDKKLARDKSWSHDDDFDPFSNGELKKGGSEFHLCWIDGMPFFTIQIYPKFPVQFP